ncbi:uncharacterized protein LOC115236659 [Formica exsecta]|uniref:uncharacterized protein LOC115236659 n=1 Tax=Formica exsecta TaxID=72781 RepID=UPI001144A8BB|nr:uncharacterized protein LOC115236659 [Formica exsecta]
MYLPIISLDNGQCAMGVFSRTNRLLLVAIKCDWFLLLESTNQRKVLIRRQLNSCSVDAANSMFLDISGDVTKNFARETLSQTSHFADISCQASDIHRTSSRNIVITAILVSADSQFLQVHRNRLHIFLFTFSPKHIYIIRVYHRSQLCICVCWGVISEGMIKKIAKAGINFGILQDTYKESGRESLDQLLSATQEDNKSRVTANKNVIEKIQIFLDKNQTPAVV